MAACFSANFARFLAARSSLSRLGCGAKGVANLHCTAVPRTWEPLRATAAAASPVLANCTWAYMENAFAVALILGSRTDRIVPQPASASRSCSSVASVGRPVMKHVSVSVPSDDATKGTGAGLALGVEAPGAGLALGVDGTAGAGAAAATSGASVNATEILEPFKG